MISVHQELHLSVELEEGDLLFPLSFKSKTDQSNWC